MNFSRDEAQCKCNTCGNNVMDYELVEILEDVRSNFDSPVIITSWNRCISHNHAVKGETKSYHLKGLAVDIIVDGGSSERVYNYLDNKYPNSKGLGSYATFTHIDVRPTKARW